MTTLHKEFSAHGIEIWFLTFESTPSHQDYYELLNEAVKHNMRIAEIFLNCRTARAIAEQEMPDYKWDQVPSRFSMCGVDHITMKDSLLPNNQFLATVCERRSLAQT